MTENDLLSGVTLSGEQKTTIEQIHREMKVKMEIVSKDDNESPEQKSAMLDGLSRMQMRQVFEALTPQQRADVRKRILAMRSANREEDSPRSRPTTH